MKNRIALRMVLSLFLSLSLIAVAYSQQRTLTGKVTDEQTGEPLPGVTVVIEGTSAGTATNFEGEYSLAVEQDQTLVFSFVGYTSKEVIVGEQDVINVQLSESATELDELVVIGYGLQKKEDKTGAVAQITAEELTRGAITDPIQSIQGKSAGVMVTKKGGDPNAGFTVKIRGASGYDSDTQPLYVIDGVPGVDPTTIAPEDIETFNILKDASSTAIYGSQGSNGVVLITTKRGSADANQLEFNVRMSVDQPSNRLDLLSADELRDFALENDLNLIDGGANTDWQDEIFRNALSTSYNLNYSGGNESTTFYASATHSDWTGVLKGTSKERTIGKINLSHKALDNRLTISSSLAGTFENNDYEDYEGYGLRDILYQAYSRNPTDPVYTEENSFYQVERAFNYVNPVATIDEVINTRDAQRFYGTLKADLEIFEGLRATVNLGYTKDDSENTLFIPRDSWATTTAGRGRRSYDNTERKLIETYFTYAKTFDNVHNLDAVIGHSWQETNYDGFAVEAIDAQSDFLGADNISSFAQLYRDGTSSYKNMSRLIGIFGRLQYNYDSKYYLSASLRRDGSTKFGENNRWGLFPTAAFGWSIHREAFLENVDVISNLKLRASYGVSGNESLGVNLSRTTFAPGGLVTNPDNGETVVTFAAENNFNPDLKWEETAEFNFGLDFGFYRNRISGSLEVYQKTTEDLLGQFPVPVPPNVARFTWGNAGSMENKGIELSTQIFAVDNQNLTWRTNLAVSRNIQINTDLGGRATSQEGVNYRPEGYISGRGLTGAWVIGLIEGESLGSFYVPKYAGIVDGVMVYESIDGGFTDVVANAKRYVAGTALPDVEIGWSNTLNFFKNWTLDVTFRSMIGNKLYNATAMMFDYPGEFPTLNRLPEAIDWYNDGRVSPPQVSDLYVEDASFLRLDFVSLSYDLLTDNIGWLSGLRIYLSGNNLLVLTNYSGLDPETSIDGLSFGIDQYNVYPKTRSVSLGLTAKF
jgi:iron complex outermembrane receptor protein